MHDHKSQRRNFGSAGMAGLACLLAGGAVRAAEPVGFELTLVDAEATHGATFQSHNQKVVHNARGIFLTHVHSRNEPFTAQQWRLSWSRDGGRTFETLYEATDATNPPTLETDAAGNLYLGRPDYVSLDVLLYRFLAREDYRTPHVTRVPKTAAGKYATALDEGRGLFHYVSHNGWYIRCGVDGAVRSTARLFSRGDDTVCEYPALDLGPDGALHVAWTSLKVARRLYWSIQHLESRDGGETWQAFGGRLVAVPVAADETGPSDRITLDDEFDASTWLSNVLVEGDKAHFLYLARTEPPRQHHVRYDVATGRRELDHQPSLSGGRLGIRSLDGFFAADGRQPGGPLYCVAADEDAARLVCLVSFDQGSTWHDHAASEPFTRPYAIGGCRELLPDGSLIGSFTDVSGTREAGNLRGRVYFFRVPAARRPDTAR